MQCGLTKKITNVVTVRARMVVVCAFEYMSQHMVVASVSHTWEHAATVQVEAALAQPAVACAQATLPLGSFTVVGLTRATTSKSRCSHTVGQKKLCCSARQSLALQPHRHTPGMNAALAASSRAMNSLSSRNRSAAAPCSSTRCTTRNFSAARSA
jgi:hypothetical protein